MEIKLTEEPPKSPQGGLFDSNRMNFVFNFQLSIFNCLQSEKANPPKIHHSLQASPDLGPIIAVF